MCKTVFVTGGAKGIGKAIAEIFYKKDYNVVINYNTSESEALSMKESMPGILVLQGDVSNEDDVKRMFDTAIMDFGRIDILVNNAGVCIPSLVTDMKVSDWEKTFGVNVTGTFLCSKYASRNMVLNHSGAIINISSIWGVSGACMESCYSASKGAVIAFTKALAKELGPSGIRVNCVSPGYIDTDMNKDISEEDKNAFTDETPLGRIGTPIEVAKAVLFLASDESSFITGQILGCDGGVIV